MTIKVVTPEETYIAPNVVAILIDWDKRKLNISRLNVEEVKHISCTKKSKLETAQVCIFDTGVFGEGESEEGVLV